MEKKHVYSILAKERRRERTSNTHKTHKTQHTKRKNKKAGPWVPSLENWGRAGCPALRTGAVG